MGRSMIGGRFVGLALAVLSISMLGGACRSASEPTSSKGASSTKASKKKAEAPVADALGLSDASTHVVIAGVLKWQDPAIGTFSDRNRKDVELGNLLIERGVPDDNVSMLLDSAATRTAVLEALAKASESTPEGGTLVFYYAGHGVRDDAGVTYLANYDLGDPKETGLSAASLVKAIRGFRGERVVLLADCCYSGMLGDVAKKLGKQGVEAISLTSADKSNLSTANWTFTQSVIDCLGGDPLADRDGDGTVRLDECDAETRDAMTYREQQRHGFAVHGGSSATDSWALAKRDGDKVERAKSGELTVGQYVHLNGREVGRVRELDGGKATVRLYDYSDATDVKHKVGDLTPLSLKTYAVGTKLRVFWEKKVWDAKVLKVDEPFMFITYPGWPSYWDEWITSDRVASEASGEATAIAFKVGDAVSVEWQGEWWPATVVSVESGKALIHYKGYDDSWDEWVGPERMRRP